jgi:hypothetical protein
VIRLPLIFHWMFEDDRWRYKLLFQGLILLIPVAGPVALLGWTMVTCDNLLGGRQDLAPFGFHLRRGLTLLGTGLGYTAFWLCLGVPLTAMRYLEARAGGSPALRVAGDLYNDAALLLFVCLVVPVLVATDRGGFLSGLDVVRVVRSMLTNVVRTLVAGVVVMVAAVIALVGLALIVAAPFAIVYAASLVASAAAWWSAGLLGEAPEPRDAASSAQGPPVPFKPPRMEPEASPATER